MMEWTLAILFCTAALLLIISIYHIKKSSKAEMKEIDMISISIAEQINQIQMQVRNIELDGEITANSGSQIVPQEKRFLLRDMLDLYKRGYSLEGIANEKQLTLQEVEELLSPFNSSRTERSFVAQ